jgi:hypothetical protein
MCRHYLHSWFAFLSIVSMVLLPGASFSGEPFAGKPDPRPQDRQGKPVVPPDPYLFGLPCPPDMPPDMPCPPTIRPEHLFPPKHLDVNSLPFCEDELAGRVLPVDPYAPPQPKLPKGPCRSLPGIHDPDHKLQPPNPPTPEELRLLEQARPQALPQRWHKSFKPKRSPFVHRVANRIVGATTTYQWGVQAWLAPVDTSVRHTSSDYFTEAVRARFNEKYVEVGWGEFGWLSNQPILYLNTYSGGLQYYTQFPLVWTQWVGVGLACCDPAGSQVWDIFINLNDGFGWRTVGSTSPAFARAAFVDEKAEAFTLDESWFWIPDYMYFWNSSTCRDSYGQGTCTDWGLWNGLYGNTAAEWNSAPPYSAVWYYKWYYWWPHKS